METQQRTRVLLISPHAIAKNLAGPPIRYLQMAIHLSRHCDVTLAAPSPSDFALLPPQCGRSEYASTDLSSLLPAAADAEVVICLPDTAIKLPKLAELRNHLVIDAYDPVLAEWLELAQSHSSGDRPRYLQTQYEQRLAEYRTVFSMGDVFLCSSTRQRDWLLGALEAAGRLNPVNYRQDATFQSMVLLAPMGVPDVSHPSNAKFNLADLGPFGEDDKLVVWSGGVWPWLDPKPLILAMQHVAARDASIKLIFPGAQGLDGGTKDLNGGITELRALASQLGVCDKSVFFCGWVEYAQWHQFLSHARLSVTLPTRPNLEGYLAYRTRMLDCVAARVPMLQVGDDVSAEQIVQAGVGETLSSVDPELLSNKIMEWVNRPRQAMATAFAELADTLSWHRTMSALTAYCQNPYRQPDRDMAQPAWLTRASFATSQAQRIAQLEDLVKRYEAGRLMTLLRHLDQFTRGRINKHGPPPIHKERARYKALLKRVTPGTRELSTHRKIAMRAPKQTTISVLAIDDGTHGGSDCLKLITSLEKQSYPFWKLTVLAKPENALVIEQYLQKASSGLDISVVRVDTAQNAFALAARQLTCLEDKFVCMTRLSCELRPNALFEIADVLHSDPIVDFVYFDEDWIDAQGEYCNPYFKPDWSPDLLLSQMYIGSCFVFRGTLAKETEEASTNSIATWWWELALRLGERARKVHHIPQVLFANTGQPIKPAEDDSEKQKKMLERELARRGTNANVEILPRQRGHYLIRWKCTKQSKVTIVICTRDKPSVLDRCLVSIFKRTEYESFQVVVVDNNSQEQKTHAVFRKWTRREPDRFRVHAMPIPFNYSALNNAGVRMSDGALVVLLNNDTEVISHSWLADMAAHAQRREIGTVGAFLLYPNDKIQHAGVIARIGPWCGHGHRGFPADAEGYHGRLLSVSEYSAVTGACMMFRRDIFDRVGGLDENLAVTCNDTEFCWRVLASGYRNIVVPTARLYHYESVTRGFSNTPEEKARDVQEMTYARDLWPRYWAMDPYYNINLTHSDTDFSLPNH